MKILVIDDTQKHLDSALLTLEGHDITLCSSYDEAIGWLEIKYDNEVIMGKCEQYKLEGMEHYNAYCKAKEEIGPLPYWDAVLCDLFMPAGRDALGGGGWNYIGQEMAVGWSLALVAARRGAKYAGVLTATDHHNHPASAMLDRIDQGPSSEPHVLNIDGARVIMTNHAEFIDLDGEEDVACYMCNGHSPHCHNCYVCKGRGKITQQKQGKDWGKFLSRLLEE